MGVITKLTLVFLFLTSVSFVTPGKMSQTKMQEEQAALTTSINQFSTSFYKETAAIKDGENLVMSPLSAQIVLALLSLGAQDETQAELNRALFTPNVEFTKSAYKNAIINLNSVKGVTLNIANKVFVKDGEQFVLHPEFKKNSVDIFASEAQNLNFNENVKAAKTINTWVEDKTNNRIKDLISSDSLSADTRLVLVNAIYFKGSWEKKFDPQRTMKKDFHVTRDNKVQVDMMHLTGNFGYAEIPEWNAKILELPYEKHEMSMVIILPNEIDGLKSLEDKMAQGNLSDMLKRLHGNEVNIALPKFKIETSIDLKKVLPKMGMKLIFDQNKANLKGLLKNDEQLYVSEAIQKAFIEVNEEGAEAAAATGFLEDKILSGQKESKDFNGNRGFFFSLINIRDEIIFNGVVTMYDPLTAFK